MTGKTPPARPFRFYTRHNLVELLGRRAASAVELLEGVQAVPGSSIYYHTHRFLQQHHYLSPEPPNDFAFWAAGTLGLAEIGERLASVDTVRFVRIEDLRRRFIEILRSACESGHSRTAAAPEGAEFHFMSCRTYILPTSYEVHDLAGFLEALNRVSIHSIYFHIFEARLRLERGVNDFSTWLQDLGYPKLAGEVARMDPYTMTLDGLRHRIMDLVSHHVPA
jgi:hypothetical protein